MTYQYMICYHSKDCNVRHTSNSKARPNHHFDSDVVLIVCNFRFVDESDNYLRTSLGLTIEDKSIISWKYSKIFNSMKN